MATVMAFTVHPVFCVEKRVVSFVLLEVGSDRRGNARKACLLEGLNSEDAIRDEGWLSIELEISWWVDGRVQRGLRGAHLRARWRHGRGEIRGRILDDHLGWQHLHGLARVGHQLVDVDWAL